MFFEFSEALQNYLLVCSWLIGIIMIPITLFNLLLLVSDVEVQKPAMAEYLSWELGYDIQILGCMLIAAVFLNMFVALLIIANVVIFQFTAFSYKENQRDILS